MEQRIFKHEISLEYLSNNGTTGRPILVVPGLSEGSDDWRGFAESMFPRPVLAVSLRGRGRSDAPKQGYGLTDHVNDILAFVEHCGFEDFHMFGFSRGVSYTLAASAKLSGRIDCLVLGDYAARHTRLPDEFPDNVMGTIWRGKEMGKRMPRHALEQLRVESHQEDLIERVDAFGNPLLVLAGNPELGGLLTDEEIERYRAVGKKVTTHFLSNSGHDLFSPDHDFSVALIREFLEKNEAS
jgi:pimeloyl-ACP methyl ester carboxylesterase